VLRKSSVVLCLLILAALDAAGAQDTSGKARNNRLGTWSATSTGTGIPLRGTWTAVPDSASGTVMGSWALVDEQGRTMAYGGWSASKSPTQWTGSWRAIVAGRSGEYAGTWSSTVDLKLDAGFADLFEKAVETIVSGDWRSGALLGKWSIRAGKRE
jgi:hypothetical protein